MGHYLSEIDGVCDNKRRDLQDRALKLRKDLKDVTLDKFTVHELGLLIKLQGEKIMSMHEYEIAELENKKF